MGRLSNFQKGWEAEKLANLMLSKFCFITEPNEGSDIGSDFYCTIFETQIINNYKQLYPKNSFCIQIKSDSNSKNSDYDLTKNIDFLMNIELPYFLGVVNLNNNSISIYSGHGIPFLFSSVGKPKILYAHITEDKIGCDCLKKIDEESYSILFPKITTLSFNDSNDKITEDSRKIINYCSMMLQNISSKINNEFLFRTTDTPEAAIFAGPESEKTFRDNFILRLCEVFYNLQWIIDNKKNEFDINEFRIYEELIHKLESNNYYKPQLVDMTKKMYFIVKNIL